jgi:biopolymer transport protein ExbD
MPFTRTDQFRTGPRQRSFNMTPVIDIVFLLIIFFVLACRFIEAENFPVNVPDGCKFAQDDDDASQAVTLTVMNKAENEIIFAVGSEEIAPHDAASLPGIVPRLAELIDVRLGDLPQDSRIVTLRIDKDIPFAQAQYALAAVAQSTATDIRLAALNEKLTIDRRID